MSKIVIIGNYPAGLSCCKVLLKGSLLNEIAMISGESCPAYKRFLLPDYLSGNVREDQLFLCGADFYEKNKVNLIGGAKIARLDCKKQAVVLKDNTKIPYDYLVIASGEKVNIPDIPGKSKDGVFTLYALEEARRIKDKLLVAGTICLVGGTDECLYLWEAFLYKEKHLKIISSPKSQFFVPSENAEWIDEANLSEIIGEGAELKAVKLTNGKAIGTDLVIFLGNYIASTEFLKESGVDLIDGYVAVDGQMRTNIENILSCGACCKNKNNLQAEKTWELEAAEGGTAAANLIALLERRNSSCQTS